MVTVQFEFVALRYVVTDFVSHSTLHTMDVRGGSEPIAEQTRLLGHADILCVAAQSTCQPFISVEMKDMLQPEAKAD